MNGLLANNAYISFKMIDCKFVNFVKTWRLREGFGVTTNNVAECQGLLLGMRCAFLKGFEVIEASGDSLLVCNQVCDSLLDCYYLLFGKNIYDSESRAKFGYDLLIPSEVSGFVWSKALET